MEPHRENWLPYNKITEFLLVCIDKLYTCVCVYIYVYIYICMYIFVVVELPSHVQLFASPWTAARQASLSLTISWSLPKFPSSLHWRCIQPSHPASLHVWVLSCLVMPVSLQPHRLSGRRLPGSPVNGILQARILEWVAIPFSRDLPNPEIKPRSPVLQVDSLPSEPPGKSYIYLYTYTYIHICV